MVSFSVRENLYTIALLCLEAYDYVFFLEAKKIKCLRYCKFYIP